MMAWAFWELSGGSDFTPESPHEPLRQIAVEDSPALTPVQTSDTPAVEEAETETDTRRALEEALAQLDDTQTTAPEDAPGSPPATATDGSEASQPAAAAPQDVPVTPAPRPETLPTTTPSDAPAPQPTDTGLSPLDLRVLDATRVNLRAGPGTDFRAIDQLSQGTVVEVLQTDTSGEEPWVRLIVPITGMEGWIAERFLIRQ